MPAWARFVVALAGAKTAVGVTLYLSGLLTATAVGKMPPWFYATLAATFGILGGVVLAGHRRDPRASWWGGFLVLIGSALAPLVSALPHPALTAIAVLRPDAFAAAFAWRFASVFPAPIEPAHERRVAIISRATVGVAAWCFLANLLLLVPDAATVPGIAAAQITRGQGSLYWPLVMGLVIPVFVVLIWRSAAAHPRKGIPLFVGGLLTGMMPFTIEVILEELFPAYKAFVRRPEIDPWVAVVLFGSLMLLPVITLYSVLFDRVLEMRWALRSALQYLLARYTIVGVTLIPFAALAIYLLTNNQEPLISLASGPRPLILGGIVLAGVVTLRLRQRWLDVVDRRYFREPYDAQQVLSQFVGNLHTSTPAELAASIQLQIAHALHADVAVFFANDARTALRHAGGSFASLPTNATLVGLALNDSSPMDLNLDDPASPLQRLPEDERQWILRGRFVLIVAIRRNATAVGMLALSAKRSALNFSRVDRQLLSAIAAAAGLALENLQLRSTPESPIEQPAKECVECSRLNPSDAPRCSCGGAVTDSTAPYVLRGVFKLERRIGAGGMGIVYKAVDLNLGREVAIKTLPIVTDAHVARLRKEARAMAAVSHPNLAVIHGVEMWRGVPHLIQEYLAGGTLANRLNRSSLSIAETLDLGITLSGVLDHLHAGGVLHCDIKPSNIGFTQSGVVKLLDFGLARLLIEAADTTTVTVVPAPPPQTLAASTSGAVIGTPHYMPPEAIGGKRPTAAFDLWSLSVVLYEAMAGRRPFEGADAPSIFMATCAPERPDLRRQLPDAPDSVAQLFDRLFALDPSARPANAAALKHDLHQLRTTAAMS